MSKSETGSRLKNVCWNPVLAALGLLITWQTAVRADDLLKLVSADSAICVQVRGLSRHTKQLESSEFAARALNTSLVKVWKASPEFKQLESAQATFKSATGSSVRSLVENTFGNEFVIAVRMTVGEGATGVLITKANTKESVEQSLESWNRFQPQTRTEITYRSVSYTKSITNAANKKSKPFFYVTFDSVLAISETESMIRRVIELHESPKDETSIDEVKNAKTALDRRDDREAASFYVNPRAFSQFDAFVPANLREYWSRLQWLSIRLNQFDDEIQLDLVVDYDNSSMPDWWTKLAAETAKNKLPLNRIPADALITISGHYSSSTIDLAIKQVLKNGDVPDDVKPARRVVTGLLLGNDLLDDVLPMLGPTWTFYAVPRDAKKSKSSPSDAMIAVALKDIKDDNAEKRKSRQAGLHNALNTGLNLLSLVHNTESDKEVSVIRKRIENGVTIHYADPVAMFQPAYAITDKYLMIATSPGLCADFLQDDAKNRLADAKVIGSNKQLDTNVQLIFANVESIRNMFKAHQDWFVWQAHKDSISKPAAQAKLKSLTGFLQLIDGTYASFGVAPSSLRLSLGAIAVRQSR
jgi:hypothetical protein